jgi:hypothetical protein
LTLVLSRTLHSPADPDPQPWTVYTQKKYWRSLGGYLLLAAKEREGYGHQEQGVPAEKVSTVRQYFSCFAYTTHYSKRSGDCAAVFRIRIHLIRIPELVLMTKIEKNYSYS